MLVACAVAYIENLIQTLKGISLADMVILPIIVLEKSKYFTTLGIGSFRFKVTFKLACTTTSFQLTNGSIT
jgi:hypothetical protein